MITTINASGVPISFEAVGGDVLVSVDGKNVGVIHPSSFELFAWQARDVSDVALDQLVEELDDAWAGLPSE